MRKTYATTTVLCALLELPKKKRYGYNISEVTGLAPGTVLPILYRLVHDGYAHADAEVGDPRKLRRPLRTYYTLTKTGKTAAQEAAALRAIRYR